MSRASQGAYAYHDLKPAQSDVVEEVLAGLSAAQKYLSPKFFYDARGSALFEAITELPEYYPTRTELGIFDSNAQAIAQAVPKGAFIVEYGSGSSLKIRRLIDIVHPAGYVPIDISAEHLQENAQALQSDYPTLHVYPVCADLTAPIELPREVADVPLVGFYPGSSIGNFPPDAACTFLRHTARTLGPGGLLLIGVDRRKDQAVLERAYNDSAGVTAAFNLNILEHLNALIGADFDITAFRHEARYNAAVGRIEMYLCCTRAHRVRIGNTVIDFHAGERIHTESSYKYTPDGFTALAADAGYEVRAHWSDAQQWFSLFLLGVRVGGRGHDPDPQL